MALFKCIVPPERSGYAATPGIETIATALDGGLGRYRADQLGASAQVTVQWTVGRNDYNYLMAFYRTAINRGSSPFLIDLILDSADALEYTANLVPGSLNLNSQSGLTYVVQATLEVQPLPLDVASDAIILARNS